MTAETVIAQADRGRHGSHIEGLAAAFVDQQAGPLQGVASGMERELTPALEREYLDQQTATGGGQLLSQEGPSRPRVIDHGIDQG